METCWLGINIVSGPGNRRKLLQRMHE